MLVWMLAQASTSSTQQIQKFPLPKLCLFDLDGTLVRQEHDNFYNFLVQHYRINNQQPPTFREYIQQTRKQKLFSDVPEELRKEFSSSFWQRYNSEYTFQPATAMDGAIDVLGKFVEAGCKVAIVTARKKIPSEVNHTLERTGLLAHIELISTLGEESLKGQVTKIEQIKKVCMDLGFEPKDSFIAGDRPEDITSGREAGCGLTIGIINGSLRIGILDKVKPDILVHSIRSVTKYFNL